MSLGRYIYSLQRQNAMDRQKLMIVLKNKKNIYKSVKEGNFEKTAMLLTCVWFCYLFGGIRVTG